MNSPIRISRSPAPMAPRTNGANSLYPLGTRTAPSLRPISRLDRVPYENLRRFSQSVPGMSAINRITNGVLSLPWSVTPPIGEEKNPAAIKTAAVLMKTLSRPNSDFNGRWRNLISGAIDDLLTLNHAFIERQPGAPDHPFWLWAANAGVTRMNKDWRPEVTGVVPKFFDMGKRSRVLPIMEPNMAVMVYNVNTYELIPKSPMEVAYGLIEAWLGLSDYQQVTTTRATQEWLLDIGEASQDELRAFREYWKVEVVEGGNSPIVAGKGLVKGVKLGAASDGGLYHKYCEYLLRMIALAFSLTARDSNITEHDNRATAGVSYDSTFDYAVRPIAEIIQEVISEEVIGYYFPGFGFKIDMRRPRSESEVRKESRDDKTAGIITNTEARAIRGLPPAPELERTTPKAEEGSDDEGESVEPVVN